MTYQVPHAPSIPTASRRWPHWYSLVSLAFHSWIIWRGIGIIAKRAASGHSFGDWFIGQSTLFTLSIVIALVCIISAIRRTNAAEVVWANGIYSGIAIITTPPKMLIFSVSYVYLFAEILGFIMILFLANIIYSLYRFFKRPK